MNFNRDATTQEASAFPSVNGRATNQHFICCSYLFNLAVLFMFSRKNNTTGLKKKSKGYEFFLSLTQICTKSLDVPIIFWPCL